MARLDTFLRVAADQKASDLHFHAGKPPMVRYNGELIALPFRELSEADARRFFEELLTPAQLETLDTERELDFGYVLEGVGRFRVNVLHQSLGLGAVFRVIPDKVATLAELRLPGSLFDLARQTRGLVLVTGPTGSGKTTTLAGIVHEINRTSACHIITIEDPIEYVHRPEVSVITQREVGAHAKSFAEALRSALREAPDVVVVGELRDYETIKLALSAAEAGVLVFATLHTNSAAKAIDRIVGACPVEVQDQVRGVLSVQLRGVIAQRLCRLASGDGRIAAIELLLPSYSVSHLIRENKVHQIDAYLRGGQAGAGGAQSLDQALGKLVSEGLVAIADALRFANDPDVVHKLAGAA